MSPMAKLSIFEKYKLSNKVLDEVNESERKILINLNKTWDDIFQEAKFSLNEDFQIHLEWLNYEKNGWKVHKMKLDEGYENVLEVRFY